MKSAVRRRGSPLRNGSSAWKAGAVAALAAVLVIVTVMLFRGPGSAPGHVRQTPHPSLPLAPDIDIALYQGRDVVGGDRVALSQLWERGPVVLNFWAGLCPPCRAEMPDFQRVYDGRRDRFILIGVDIGPYIGLGSREDAKALLRDLRITYPAGTALDARTVRNYQLLGMPTTVFITPQGRVLRKHTGLLTQEQMNGYVTELLEASRRTP